MVVTLLKPNCMDALCHLARLEHLLFLALVLYQQLLRWKPIMHAHSCKTWLKIKKNDVGLKVALYFDQILLYNDINFYLRCNIIFSYLQWEYLLLISLPNNLIWSIKIWIQKKSSKTNLKNKWNLSQKSASQ